jgi:hypothetical protein
MASKNPSNDIASSILLRGGFDPCSKFPENATLWKNSLECDKGFIPDKKNKYCYMLFLNEETFIDGEKYCKNNHDAEMILFDTNSQVEGFLQQMRIGKIY